MCGSWDGCLGREMRELGRLFRAGDVGAGTAV